jgi:predicted DCC family thiol-disulfide oxidoreductase YuxK
MVFPQAAGPVLLYDGDCGLCNRVVRRLLALDREGKMRFAPLQGPSAQAYLRSHALPTADFSTLVFVPDWPVNATPPRLRTDGVIAALRAAGRPGLAGLLAVFPRVVRDAGYNFVARVRDRIFGPWRACPLPRPEWLERFIE